MYKYYNVRQDGMHENDCVCRAITVATGLKYNAINKLLEITALMNDCDKLCICCYHNLLEEILGYQCVSCKNYKKRKVKDIAKIHSDKKVLIRIEGHLTVSLYGNVLDIWDCTNEIVDCYWVII